MSGAKRRRWVCPLCGQGRLGPQKPRMDDMVRVCAPCSEKTGRIVYRTCPVADAARESKKTRAAERKAQANAALREKEARRWTFGGFDLRAEAKRLLKQVGLSPKDVKVELRTRRKGTHTSGSISRGRIVLTLPEGVSAAAALAILCDAVALHAADGHGDRFRSMLVELAGNYGARIKGACASSADLYEAVVRGLSVALNETPPEQVGDAEGAA